jgi:RHH-type transcriptional regulator, proline utilization regulon repressor / proline dehydrogenase / delta 1-pyrroline-5-carboxylate dehydrogenase
MSPKIVERKLSSGWNLFYYREYASIFDARGETSHKLTQLGLGSSDEFCIQTTLNSVSFLLGVFPSDMEIRIYSSRLGWEMFLRKVELSTDELDVHVERLLQIDKKKMPTDIIRRNPDSEFPEFFGETFWADVSRDTYMEVNSFAKKLGRYFPSVFERVSNWGLGLVAKHDSLRNHMLKFLSVLPTLDFDENGEEVMSSLNECLDDTLSDKKLPLYIRLGLDFTQHIFNHYKPKTSAHIIRSLVRKMATRFVVDEKHSRESLEKLFSSGRDVTLDRLGELVLSEEEADLYCNRVIAMMDDISSVVTKGERNLSGILKSHVSIKISALCSEFRAQAFDHTYNRVAPRLRKIFDHAIQTQTFVHVDAEHYHYRDCVFGIFKKVLVEYYPNWEDVGIVVQCYLKDSQQHLKEVTEFTRKREIVMPIRLVKGAYWDAETIETEVHGHTSYQYLNKEETDICFRQLVGYSFDNRDALQICVGSHNYIDHLFVETLWKWNYPRARRPEHQCLHMTYEALSVTMAKMGWSVRDYLPVGDLIDGMAYLVRRIMENSSQKGVLSMMRSHKDTRMKIPPTDVHVTKITENRIVRDPTLNFTHEFFNVPPVRLFIEDERKWVDLAIEETEIADVELTDESELKEMVDNSMHGQKKWISKVLPNARASVIVNAAQKLLMRRTEFAVIIAKETRKTIDESLADVDEAIDFMNFYAREEVKLPRLLCRGPFVVIAPWNFPLAIPCGMAVGPLVAGNSVLLKSSSKSHYVVEKFVELMHESGVPKNVLFHVKGGGKLADELLNDERIRGCVFTGSKEVGANILKKVGPRIGELDGLRFSAKVIAETGGKNAIIVTATADMDEAVDGTIKSAFTHAGQKCSACSRVIVDNRVKDKFIRRLSGAVDSIVVGDALDYSTFVNPVIDEKETKRLIDEQWKLRSDIQFHGGRLIQCDSQDKRVTNIPTNVTPMVVDIPTENALRGDAMFHKELFGPVLHVVGYDDIETAVKLFNGTEYGLTGGIFSQSQREIQRYSYELECGNVYVNRTITGARVEIEPFGGFKMSGTGPKAGGRSYLHSFHLDRERPSVWLKEHSAIRKVPGQDGYLDRMFHKKVCFVCKGGVSWFAKDCMDLLASKYVKFDAVGLDGRSELEINDAIRFLGITGSCDHISKRSHSNKKYDMYVVGDELDVDVMKFIYYSIDINKNLPIVITKFDYLTSESLSDALLNTRTFSVNTMRHGAELI